jgi:hypothetical protein
VRIRSTGDVRGKLQSWYVGGASYRWVSAELIWRLLV